MEFFQGRQYSRRDFFKLSATIASSAALAGALGACAPKDRVTLGNLPTASPEDINPNGTIDAAISYELGTNGYDPMTTTSALTIAANWHTLEGLTEIDPASGEVYAALASVMPEGDSTNVKVDLRKGARFHNGQAVSAEDVAYSFQRVLNPDNKSLYASFIPFIESVTQSGPTSVTIQLSKAVNLLPERLSVVKIVPKNLVEEDPEGFDANPVGTGPFKMTDNGGTSKAVRFERNDDYNGPRPARAKHMVWQVIPDASTRSNAIQSESVQAIDSVPYLSITQLKATSKVESVQGFGLLFAMFNNDPSNPFHDLRNRQAFLYAIDMDKVIEVAMLDQATKPTSFLQKDHPNYHRASTVYDHDVERARKLFQDSGLRSLRMLCTDHDWVKKCTPLIAQSLKDTGVEVDFIEKKSSDVYNTIDGKPDAYDVVIAPGDPSVFGNDPDLLMRWWYSGDTWTESRMHWKGQPSYTKMQQLLDSALYTQDAKEQQQRWNQCFDLLSDEVPLYPLFHRKTPTAWNPGTLVNFEPISLTGLRFLDVGSTQ